MADETISEKCETLYNKLNSFVASVISRDVTPKLSNLNTEVWGSDTQTGNSRIDILNTNFDNINSSITTMESDINNVESSINSLNTSITNMTDTIYPIGSIYMSVNNTDPSVLFGGTWERIKDRFLLSAGDKYSNGATGGEATHTLTTNEIPSHHHQTGNRGVYSGNGTANALVGYNNSSSTSREDTSNTGGGQPHNNMPPYIAVYVWKRTA